MSMFCTQLYIQWQYKYLHVYNKTLNEGKFNAFLIKKAPLYARLGSNQKKHLATKQHWIPFIKAFLGILQTLVFVNLNLIMLKIDLYVITDLNLKIIVIIIKIIIIKIFIITNINI